MSCARSFFPGFCLISLLLLSTPQSLQADATPQGDKPGQHPTTNHPQTKCPVMGGPIDKGLYVDVKGKRIYLCCAACEDAIRAEPDKYIEKIERRGETVEDSPLSR